LSSTNYPYREDGILPDGSRVPDIPILTLLIVRRDLRKGLVGESIVDTGFDAGIYANLNLAEFLEGASPRRTTSLRAAGHSVSCEIFDAECHIVDQCSKPVLPLGRVEVFCPVDPIDLSEDVIVGRAILNRLKLELNGKLAKMFPPDIIK
jgi:predicted aspartyl protease